MKLAVSNIGWNIRREEDYLKVLKKYKISNLEVVPLKLFKNWKNIKKIDILKVKKKFFKKNFKIISMQGVFFKKDYSFYEKKDLKKIISHFKKIIFLSKYLDCKHIVFGSPKMRSGDKAKHSIGLSNFILVIKRIKSLLKKDQIYLSIEPISKTYGCSLLNNISETINFCKKIKSKYVKVQIDTGQIIAENENLKNFKSLEQFSKHLHISNSDLKNIVNNKKLIKKYLLILKKINSINFASIEMGHNYSLKEMKKAIKFAKIYIK